MINLRFSIGISTTILLPRVLCLQTNVLSLCFPTATRLLKDDELYTFEELTNHFIRVSFQDESENESVDETFVMAQNWARQPSSMVSKAIQNETWLTVDDDVAAWTPFREDACWTVKLQMYVDDAAKLQAILTASESDAIYMGILRLGLSDEFFVASAIPSGKATTTTITQSGNGDSTTTTTTTTTVTFARDWIWLWIVASVLTVGSLTILAIWNIYLRPSPFRYLRKNDSQDGTTDQQMPDQEEPLELEFDTSSSCLSYCTSS